MPSIDIFSHPSARKHFHVNATWPGTILASYIQAWEGGKKHAGSETEATYGSPVAISLLNLASAYRQCMHADRKSPIAKNSEAGQELAAEMRPTNSQSHWVRK